MNCRNFPQAIDSVQGVAAYAPGISLCPIDLRLDGNEGLRPSKKLLARIMEAGVESLRRYPDRQPLEDQLAKMLDLAPEKVLVTAGADDSLDRICRAYLDRSRTMIVATPTFEMIPRYARLTGAQVLEVPWTDDSFPVDGILNLVDTSTGVIAVVSPNNPTGSVATPADLARLSEAAPGVLLLVDMAYGEFAREDLMPAVMNLPNALGVRSLSKAWGLAGLRVGYVAGPAPLISCLRTAGGPYAVSGPSLLMASEALNEQIKVDNFVDRICQERTILQDDLTALGASPRVSQGNFVYAEFQNPGWVRDGLAGTGIAVRRFNIGPGPGPIRISCPGDEGEFKRLRHSLQTVLAPQALLLDMDGVLADVRQSYHQAIIETARYFNEDFTASDITTAKGNLGSNNDWVLTQKLLAGRGVSIRLEDITEQFQKFYGMLSQKEKLIPESTLLERLADKIPLAIVTGRPRQEAKTFLKSTGISRYFKALICLEDGPGKPDPATVNLALQQLGVQRAWMVGDTVNDMAAARAAGVLPLGVVPPGESFSDYGPSLIKAGAGRVLASLSDLEEVLPK